MEDRMELINKTPFPAILYVASDCERVDHQIVVMKVSYKMERVSENQWGLKLIRDESIQLCMADEYWGEVGLSSVKMESDLAPFKPKCDVILSGSAHTANHKEMPAIAVKLKLSYPEKEKVIKAPIEPKPLNPMMPLTETQKKQYQHELAAYEKALKEQENLKYITQIDKTLSVLGESEFKPNFLLPGWKRTFVKKFTELPLRWEYSFGGAHKLHYLPDESDDAFYHQACFSNPIGRGWIENGFFNAFQKMNAKRKREERILNYKIIPAPRIEGHKQRQNKPNFFSNPKSASLTTKQMAQVIKKYDVKAVGFGFTGRSWSPRISYSGTYDQKWIDEQHPYPPKDMDYSYWNAAPEDQQIDFFYPKSKLELWNLTHPSFSKNGYVCFHFSDHYPYLKLKMEAGNIIPWPMTTETVFIDTDKLIISLTHKAWIPHLDPEILIVESHFKQFPEIKIFEKQNENKNEIKEFETYGN